MASCCWRMIVSLAWRYSSPITANAESMNESMASIAERIRSGDPANASTSSWMRRGRMTFTTRNQPVKLIPICAYVLPCSRRPAKYSCHSPSRMARPNFSRDSRFCRSDSSVDIVLMIWPNSGSSTRRAVVSSMRDA